MIVYTIVVAILIGVYGKFLTNHLTKVMKEEFKYYLGLIKKDTNLFQDTISFKETFNKKHSQLPIIKIKIENKMCNMLIDTGANINVLHEGVFNEINKDNTIELIKPKECVVVGSGNMNAAGVAHLNFSHKREKFTEEFDIINLTDCIAGIGKNSDTQIDGILGNGFFVNNRWSIDFENMVVWVK